MNFVAIIQYHNELPENLPRAVASARKLCQHVIGYDDGSTDGSGEWGDRNLDVNLRSAENNWKQEIQHKKMMLDVARMRFHPDWILWIDADEELSPPAVAAIPRLIAARPDLTGICIPEINLWRSKTHYRVDRAYGNAGFLRLWKVRPELVYHDVGMGLHQPQFPLAARECMETLRYPDEPMIHYSWDSPEKIRAKHARYAAQGQCGESLDRLEDDPNAVLVPVKPEWFWPNEK